MTFLSSSELAATLKVSKARVSQYVSERKLEGCYSGEGRARRFDLAKVAVALGRTLDPGQMMGNGAATKSALRRIVPLPGLGPDQDDEAAEPGPVTRPRASVPDSEPAASPTRTVMSWRGHRRRRKRRGAFAGRMPRPRARWSWYRKRRSRRRG